MKNKKAPKNHKISILGDGAWGTTLAKILAQNGHEVLIWGIAEDNAKAIDQEKINHRYLPGVKLPDNIRGTHNHKKAHETAEIIIFATPSQYARQTLRAHKPHFSKNSVVLNISKGIEKDSLKRMSEVIKEELGPETRVATLSGPTIASEIVNGMPAMAVIASDDREFAKSLCAVVKNKHFKTYASSDLVGVELAGSLKNVIALAGGIADGYGYGANTKAAITTRGLAEMMRLAVAMGAKHRTFHGVSGLGDLVTTCFSEGSRNRTVGQQLASGRKISEILSEMTAVAEGVETARSAYQLSLKFNIKMPITEKIYKIIYEDAEPHSVIDVLVGDIRTRE